jgi:pimeloyl-ACP methyl ester carboxylesterase
MSTKLQWLPCFAAAVFIVGAGPPPLSKTAGQKANSSAVQDEYVNLGTYRLHAVVAGHGKPVVVFESGMGDGTSSWQKVQPEIAQLTKTLAYDRPGLGKSDQVPEPHDLNQSAAELHALLQKSGTPPPYILVGHSMGGLIVRVFAHTYPRETAGLVLVDPSDEGFDERLHATVTKDVWDSYQSFMKHHLADPTMRADMRGMTSPAEAAAAVPLPNGPKILLSASQLDATPEAGRPFRAVTMALHREWVRKTPNAELVEVPTAEHYIQNVAPEAVISAIRKVLKETVALDGDAMSRANGR